MRFSPLRDASGTANVFSNSGNLLEKDRSRSLTCRESAPRDPDPCRGCASGGGMASRVLVWHERPIAHDAITGGHWDWAQHDFVRLGRDAGPVHVIHVERERHETSPC